MGQHPIGTARKLFLASALFLFLRYKPGRYFRWLAQLHPVNVSRNRVARVLMAALLVFTDFMATVGPAYAQTTPPSVSGSIAGQGVQSPGVVFVDLRLANNTSSPA